MGKILSEEQCRKIKELNEKFRPYTEKGWMCEGSEYGEVVCNCIFNNDTDESFMADYDGNILDSTYVSSTGLNELKTMAKIQGDIRKVIE